MPIFVANSNRRRVLFRAAVAAVLGFSILVLFSFFIELLLPVSREPFSDTYARESYHYYYTAANDKKVALSFDDGPTDTETLANMAVLLEHNVPGSFLFIGRHVLARPEVAKTVAEKGFTIGNHSFTHSKGAQTSERRLAVELRATEMLISRTTGQTPTYYRPPFLLGIGVDPAPNPYILPEESNGWALAQGYHPVGIDIDTKDWASHSPEEIVANFKSSLKKTNGHIALFHDVPPTAAALKEIIPWLKEQGYSIVPLQELLEPPEEILLTRDLRFGDTNRTTSGEISLLQWFLYKRGLLDPYVLNGVFDEDTRDAVVRYQSAEKLVDPTAIDPVVAGVVGAVTREHIAAETKTLPFLPKTPSRFIFALHNIQNGYVYLLSVLGSSIGILAAFALGVIALRTLVLGFLLGIARFRPQKLKNASEGWGPSITVLIPAYNEAENIRSTIESVLNNTYRNREIVVLDDGSTDRTASIVEGMQGAYPEEKLTLLRLQNGGKARALNIGTSHAKGDLIAILDGDAALDTYALEMIVRPFVDPAVGAVAGKVATANQRGLLDRFQALEYAVGQNIDKQAFSVLGAVGVVPGPAGAWRREAIIALGGFPTDTLVEDQDMTLTFLRAGYKVVYEPRAISYTETPHTVSNFLKQRFRWVYGTMQCFWKHKGVFIERPTSSMSYLVMPNTLFFGILLPITYPVVDTILIFSIFFGAWQAVLVPILIFTLVDMLYVYWGLSLEKGSRKGLILFVPLQRIFYRQLLYYTVIKSLVRAIEGRGAGWNKFVKVGETERFFFSNLNPTLPNQSAR